MEASLRTGSLFRRIIRTYRSESVPLLAFATIVFVPLGLLEAAAGRLAHVGLDGLSAVEAGALSLALLVQAGTALLGEVFYSGAVSSIIVAGRAGRPARLGEIARHLPYWRLIAVDVLFAIGFSVGLLLLIVPGLLFLAYFALAAPVVDIERRGVREGFRRSAQLVRGHLWIVLAVLLSTVVVLEGFTELGGRASSAALGDSLLGEWLGTTVIEIATTPVYAAAAAVLTIELIEARGERVPDPLADSAPPK